MAHELTLAGASGACLNSARSQKEALEVWNQVYRGRLGVCPDRCITADAFWRTLQLFCFSVAVLGVAPRQLCDPDSSLAAKSHRPYECLDHRFRYYSTENRWCVPDGRPDISIELWIDS